MVPLPRVDQSPSVPTWSPHGPLRAPRRSMRCVFRSRATSPSSFCFCSRPFSQAPSAAHPPSPPPPFAVRLFSFLPPSPPLHPFPSLSAVVVSSSCALFVAAESRELVRRAGILSARRHPRMAAAGKRRTEEKAAGQALAGRQAGTEAKEELKGRAEEKRWEQRDAQG